LESGICLAVDAEGMVRVIVNPNHGRFRPEKLKKPYPNSIILLAYHNTFMICNRSFLSYKMLINEVFLG